MFQAFIKVSYQSITFFSVCVCVFVCACVCVIVCAYSLCVCGGGIKSMGNLIMNVSYVRRRTFLGKINCCKWFKYRCATLEHESKR